MKLTSQSCTRFLLGALCVAVLAHSAYGQSLAPASAGYGGGTIPQLNQGEGIAVGPFMFSPAIMITWENRDNIFLTADNPVADQVYLIRARLLFELPVYHSYVRFNYTPQARAFKDLSGLENWSHFLDVTTGFEFAGGYRLNALYRFASANLETRLVDPGGEVAVGGRQFERHFVSLTGSYWITERDGISVVGDYTDVQYKRVEGASTPNYNQVEGGAGWLHQLSPTTVMDLTYRHRKYEPGGETRATASTGDEVTVGVKGQLTPLLSADGSFGFRKTAYEANPENPDASDFQGLVMDGHITYSLAHSASVQLVLRRSDFPSYAGNAFYTATGASLLYSKSWSKLFADARVRYQVNSYDQPDNDTGLDREDKISVFGIGFGYRLNEVLSFKGSYLYEDRNSLEAYAYEANVFLLGLVFGY